MIEDYGFGHIEVAGQAYTNDLIVHGSSVTSWRRAKGHRVAVEDIEAVVAAGPATLVVGTGAYGLMRVPNETRGFIEEHGITLLVERTARAVARFNRLQAQGDDVAIAMHLTC